MVTRDRFIRRPPGQRRNGTSGPPVSAAPGTLRSGPPTCPRSPVITGTGTAVNVATVLLGATVGVLAGHRLPSRTRDLVTDALGLVTLLIAGLSVVSVNDPALAAKVGSSAPLLIVLGSLVLGGIVGSLLRLEERVEGLAGWLQSRLSRSSDSTGRARFIEGFVTA